METVFCADIFKQVHFLFEKQKPDKQLAVVEKVLSLLLFVEFEIIGSSAGWMRAENTLIQTAEYDFCLLCIKVFSDLYSVTCCR